MYSAQPSLNAGDARTSLARLITTAITPETSFSSAIRRLDSHFALCAGGCPVPLPAAGLIVTPEIRCQSELYQPIREISAVVDRLYRSALTYPPILSSTPFFNALSWADVFSTLSPKFQFSANPARLLERLLVTPSLLTEFLFDSFLPRRFYGGSTRYPGQRRVARDWLNTRRSGPLRCLDAACGIGEESYALALTMLENGFEAKRVHIEGWTVEPLEVWAAAHLTLPHDHIRERMFREAFSGLFAAGYQNRIRFSCVDLYTIAESSAQFDLILCNGLLGGPIVNDDMSLMRIIARLERVLSPGGMLLAANSFHGGWKQQCPQEKLRALFEKQGLKTGIAGEGIFGLKADQ